jgi:hypothetical protein
VYFTGEEEVVEAIAREYLTKLTDRLHSEVVAYLKGIPKFFSKYFVLKPTLEMNVNFFEYGVEVHVRMYFDGKEIAKLKEAIRAQLRDNKLRIKAYADIVNMRIRATSGELHALLSDLYSGATTGGGETGVPGEEIRGQEGGHIHESPNEDNI